MLQGCCCCRKRPAQTALRARGTYIQISFSFCILLKTWNIYTKKRLRHLAKPLRCIRNKSTAVTLQTKWDWRGNNNGNNNYAKYDQRAKAQAHNYGYYDDKNGRHNNGVHGKSENGVFLRTRAAGISLCAGHGGIAASIHFCIGKMKHGAYPFAVLSKLMVLL